MKKHLAIEAAILACTFLSNSVAFAEKMQVWTFADGNKTEVTQQMAHYLACIKENGGNRTKERTSREIRGGASVNVNFTGLFSIALNGRGEIKQQTIQEYGL